MVTLADVVDVVSPSKLETASQCLAKVLFRYVERRRGPWRADAQFGNAIDDTGNQVYGAKLKCRNRKTPSKRDAQEMFAAAWDYESSAIDDWQGDTHGSILDRGVRMVALWRERIAQFAAPKFTQQKLTVVLPDPISGGTFGLTGIVDMVGKTIGPGLSTCDLKQSGQAFPANKMVRSFQPVAYTLLTQQPMFEFHVLIGTQEPGTQIMRRTISDSEREAFLVRAGMIRRQIAHAWQTGDWLPNRTHMLCSWRYCEHAAACEKRYGGRVPE